MFSYIHILLHKEDLPMIALIRTVYRENNSPPQEFADIMYNPVKWLPSKILQAMELSSHLGSLYRSKNCLYPFIHNNRSSELSIQM